MNHNKDLPVLNIAMYPWFAIGHLTPFIDLANRLAKKGHKVSYIIPTKTHPRLAPLNQYPNHLSFIPITVPPVDGLPPDAETTNDVPSLALPLLNAMDLTRDTVEAHLASIKPDIVIYDFAHWIPDLARKLGFKSVFFIVTFVTSCSSFVPYLEACNKSMGGELIAPPPPVKLQDGGLSIPERLRIALGGCDAVGAKSCMEVEGAYIEYFGKVVGKPMLPVGPMILKNISCSTLDEHIDAWLKGFGTASVIYCAFGSECILELNQFQELLLGLELTGRPFFVALKKPKTCKTMESALPKGFDDRTRGRGIVHEGWVQQQLILQHPSVGCFITHCGVGSLWEGLVRTCQLVFMPHVDDQFINAKMMSSNLKAGVEVEIRDNDCLFTKEAIFKAVSIVMEEDSKVGKEVRASHAKWREFLLQKDVDDCYIDNFIKSLRQLNE